MSLNWDIRNVANHEQVCFVGTGKDRHLNPVTDCLIWYTLIVDLPGVTEKNVDDFYARMRLNDRLFGTLLKNDKGDRPITYEELRAHIGLHTNVSPRTWAQVVKKLTGNFLRDQQDVIRHRNVVAKEA